MEKIPERVNIRQLSEEELTKFKFNLPSKFEDRVTIVNVYISTIKKNENTSIKVTLSGTISKGFLDLFIRDSYDNDFWFPDINYWNNIKDEGMLDLNNETKLCEWSFKLSDYAKGNFRIFVLIFEDSDGNTYDKRKVVTGVEVLP